MLLVNDHVCYSAFNRVYFHLYHDTPPARASGPQPEVVDVVRTEPQADQTSIRLRAGSAAAPAFQLSSIVCLTVSSDVVDNDKSSENLNLRPCIHSGESAMRKVEESHGITVGVFTVIA